MSFEQQYIDTKIVSCNKTLPWGTCRVHQEKQQEGVQYVHNDHISFSGRRRRRRQRQDAEKVDNVNQQSLGPGVLWIYNNNGSNSSNKDTSSEFVLCHLSERVSILLNSNDGENKHRTLLCYDDSIRVRISQGLAKFQSLLLESSSSTFVLAHVDDDVPEFCKLQETRDSEGNNQHCHSYIDLLSIERKSSNTISKFETIGCFLMTELVPISSITLSMATMPSSSSLTSSTNSDTNIRDPLLHSCIKRQLVQCPVLFCNKHDLSFTTQIRLSILNNVYMLQVQSVIAASTSISSPNSSSSSRLLFANSPKLKTTTMASFTYVIIPSTRITLSVQTIVQDDTKGNTDFAPSAMNGSNYVNSGIAFTNDSTKTEKISDGIVGNINDVNSINNFAMSPVAQKLVQHILLVLQSSSVLKFASSSLSQSFILSGPPGVGKTHAVRTAVEYLQNNDSHGQNFDVKLQVYQGSQVTGVSTQSSVPDVIRSLQQAVKNAQEYYSRQQLSCAYFLFLDECDALFTIPAVASAFAHMLDEINNNIGDDNTSNEDEPQFNKGCLVVVAATNRIEAIPDALRRPGRFDHEIYVAPPSADERLKILTNLLKRQQQKTDIEPDMLDNKVLHEIALDCVGYVPADLAALVQRAQQLAWQDQELHIRERHLRAATTSVVASALRDTAQRAPPTTTWSNIAGDPGGAKTLLRQAVEWPRTRAKAFKALGLTPPRGVLLYGPPGCAKTTLARAVAGSAGVAFCSLAPADVYASSYVGEAEAVVRRTFAMARSCAPCVLFLDELDAIIGNENNSSGGQFTARGSSVEARVLTTLLNEMDGIENQRDVDDGVLLLAATNRPWTIDAALLRPGRLDKCILVPAPDVEGRCALLRQQTCEWKTDVPIDYDDLASDAVTGSLTGAEIVGACRLAGIQAIRNCSMSDGKSLDDVVIPAVSLKQCLLDVQPLLRNPSVMQEFVGFQKRNNI